MQMHRIYFILLLLLTGFGSFAQPNIEVIPLRNPSFEDYPRPGTEASRAPLGWYDCGKPGETAPDIQPGQFEVTKLAFHDTTYLGMVVRDNDTWEAVGQRLRRPLEKGKCYTFGLHLARSTQYVSISRTTNAETSYTNPIKLRIWGGNGYCSKQELLDETDLVTHTDWKAYQFRFEPTGNHSFILFEAFWKTPVLMPTNGNILLDNASDIYVIPCDEEPPLAAEVAAPVVEILNPQRSGLKSEDNTFAVRANIKNMTTKDNVRFLVNGNKKNFSFDPQKGLFRSSIPLIDGSNKIEITATNEGGSGSDNAIVVYSPKIVSVPSNPQPSTITENYVHNPELANKVEQGKVLKINKLYFEADSVRITQSVFPILDELVVFMRANAGVSIEVGGHTNNRCATQFCNDLSEDRAKSVVNYLVSKGIRQSRLSYKGYGKTKPVATNETLSGRRKNQRVEVKILKMNG